jgi:hypothetical protein
VLCRPTEREAGLVLSKAQTSLGLSLPASGSLHDLTRVPRVWIVLACEPHHDAGLILRSAVLAHFIFAGQRLDLEREAHDAAKLRLDEPLRRVRHGPGISAPGLVKSVRRVTTS